MVTFSHSDGGLVRNMSERVAAISAPVCSLGLPFRSVTTEEAPSALRFSIAPW